MQKRKTYIAFVILGLLCSLTACDTCDPLGSGGTGNDDNIIYVTAFPLNGLTPTVFTVDMDNFSTAPLISNATIYSPPSANGRIAFLRHNTADSSNSIWLMRTDKTDSMLVFTDNDNFSAAYPVLSPNGDKIVFYGGSGSLLLWKSVGQIDRISRKAISGTLAAFSPDGQKLAFLEADLPTNSVALKIVSVDNTDLVLKSIVFDSATVRSGAEITPMWDNSSKTVAVNLTLKGIDCVYLLNDQKADTVALPEFGIRSAALSPDGTMLCFTASNGSLWIRDLAAVTPAYYKVAEFVQNEFNFCTPIGITRGIDLFTVSSTPTWQVLRNVTCLPWIFHVADGIKAVNKTIVTTNVYKGFWGKRK